MKASAVFRPWTVALVLVATVLGATAWHQAASVRASQVYAAVTLLIPDTMRADAPEVRIWTDAASERGVRLHPLRASEWMRGVNYGAPAARQSVIVPDTFHREMPDALVQTIYRVVESGGNAMVVHDAGLLTERGFYHAGSSRFSDLLGVRYGDFDRWKEQLSHYSEIRGAPATLEQLGIPPGRYLDAAAATRLTSIARTVLQQPDPLFPAFVAGYSHDSQRFAVLRAEPAGAPTVLLSSGSGDVVASLQVRGRGKAVFVNLPLTYLVERTDGIFLHGFLRYFASEIAGQPLLLAAPNGIGALALNWHNDDGQAIRFLHTLQQAGIFDHGHQSMHFTAGPDVNRQGDGMGMDLDRNPDAQAMIARLREQGHTIGNHGGWMHNYFGHSAHDGNGEAFAPLLDLNNAAVTRANGGQQPREYSAPMGNQPLWVYDWFSRNGIEVYYTSANVGMPPTRLWMGKRRMGSAWSFPVLTYGQVASAEEASFQDMPIAEFDAWLQQIARFIEQQRAVRLSYFHPIGAVMYLPAIKHYIDTVQRCADRRQCQFISMTEAAEFLSRREQAQWSLRAVGDSDELSAHHPTSLETLTWSIPRSRYAAVHVISGQATIEESPTSWLVRVQRGRELSLQLRRPS
ncbi:polysaccharide deacetylase family protein [Comamonas humi]